MPGRLARILRWVLLTAMAFLVLAVVAVELLPWSFLKEPVEERFEAATGRSLSIEGNLSLSLFPRPVATINGLTLDNPDWAEAPNLLEVKRIRVMPSLWAALTGDLVLNRVTIEAPRVDLEERADGTNNWGFPGLEGSPPEEQSSAPPLAVNGLALSDARIRYRNADQAPIPLSVPSLGSQLRYEAGRWAFTDIKTTLATGQVTGELEIDTDGQIPVVRASLHSPEFDVPTLLAALPESDEAFESPVEAIPVLPQMAARLTLFVDRLLLEPQDIRNLKAELDLRDQVLTLESLEFDAAGGRVVGNAELASDSEALALELTASVDDLDLAMLDAPKTPAGIVGGELAFSVQQIERQPAPELEQLLEHLRIERATGTYTGEAGQADIRATLETVGESASPRMAVTGNFRDQPIEATLDGDPLQALSAAPGDYALQAIVKSGSTRLEINTDLASTLEPQSLAATFELNADNVRDMQPWLGLPLPSVSGLRAAGQLERNAEQWDASALEIEAGESSATGEIRFRNSRRPFVEARVHAARVNPLPWLPDADDQADATESDAGTPSDDGGSVLAALRGIDAQLDLRIDQLDPPADSDMKQIVVSAELEDGNARIDPLRFAIAEGQVMAALDLEVSAQRALGHLTARFDGIALDRMGETFTPLEDRLGKLSGMLDIEITETRSEDLRDNVKLPWIGRVRFEDSQLRFENPDAQTDLTLTLQTQGLDDGAQELHVDGRGQYDGDPFTLTFRGDELLHVRDPERRYSLQLDGRIVESRFSLRGTLLRPLELQGMDLELSLEGPNPQHLNRVLGIPFPLLPAYSVSGDLSLDEERWLLQELAGRVGDSDLSGQLGLDGGVQPPHVSARLESDSVRIEDLAGVFGARPEMDTPESDNRLVLPQQPFIGDAWDAVTADVRYRGRSLQAGNVPVSDLVINFLLEDGNLQFAPVGFGVGDGSVDFNLDLDVTERPSHGTLQATVRGVDLQKALSEWDLTEDSVGIVGGQGKFWVEGDSIADILASADGGLLILMHGGRLDAVLVEMAGLDATQVFTSLLRDRGPVPIDCVYIDVKTRDGLATLDTLVIDTDDTAFTAGGEVDLAEERLDITVLANPKDASVGVARTPIQITGTFNDIDLGISAGGLGARLGSAAVLGAVATPVAALLPLLDLGTGEDSGYCQGLTRRSHEALRNQEDSR